MTTTRPRRWATMRYRSTTARWGIGPVRDGHWRTTLGISIVIAGHGYALYRLPRNQRPSKRDRSSPFSRA
jgi:hypothetical protein